MGRLYNLTVGHFNPEEREFSLLLNIPRPPYSMLGYNRTITRTNINVLINIGPGAGGGRKRRGKKGNLPNTFNDVVYQDLKHDVQFVRDTERSFDELLGRNKTNTILSSWQ